VLQIRGNLKQINLRLHLRVCQRKRFSLHWRKKQHI